MQNKRESVMKEIKTGSKKRKKNRSKEKRKEEEIFSLLM